jgi:hypothetical protein
VVPGSGFVTAATLQGAGGRRSLVGKLGSALLARARAKGKPSRLAAAIAVARQHVMTAAALASADFGAFHWGTGVGFLVLGASLLALDFAVTG